jgi:copper transport protein
MFLSSVLLILLQGVDVTGGALKDLLNIDNARGVRDTRVGHALGARGVLALMLLVAGLIFAQRRAVHTQFFEFVSVLVLVAAPFTFAFAGHASVGSPQVASVVASVAHVIAVATWFGGLVVLIFVTEVRTRPIVEWFSKRAAILIAVAVVSGALSSLIIVDGLRDIAQTAYGVGLLVKVSFVGAMLLVAALVRRRFYESGVTTLRSLLVAEVLVGVVVLGLTAGISGASPREDVSNAPFSTTLVQGDIIASITLSPARTGQAEMHVILSPPNGSLSPVVGAKARLSLSSRDLPPIQVALSLVGPNHYVGLVQIPYTGEWQLDVVVNATANTELLYRTSVVIRQ